MRIIGLFLAALPCVAFVQSPPPAGASKKTELTPAQMMLSALKPRELGPTTMGGRISDIAVYEKEPRIFYVSTASGGLLKTENGGISLTPCFSDQKTVSLGAVAVSQKDPNLVWVGTGESAVRNSVSWGDGVYKSVDGGKSWKNMGLGATRRVSRVLIDPKNNDTVLVGALGALWKPNEERGVYRTADGGKSWTQTLKINAYTGIADMAMNPQNSNEILAATWQVQRYPWNLKNGGLGSGLYKSKDGGKNWYRVTSGLPPAPMGRIGLSYSHSNPKIVFATVERPPQEGMGEDVAGKIVSGGLFKSTDGGESWVQTSLANPRPFYFSTPRVDPNDPEKVYVLGVEIHRSDDGGRTVRTMDVPVHSDHHTMWIDPKDSYHLLVGCDGGLAQSRDRGKSWEIINNFTAGQFYAVAFDYRKPYYVYGGLQDNGTWGGPSQGTSGGVMYTDWFNVGGGDGFHAQVDPENWQYVYSESQGGSAQRLNQLTGERASIVPQPPKGERYRFNWSSPIAISPHNAATIYFGGNKLFKSVNRGSTWKVISPDLTTNDPNKQKTGEGSVSPESTSAEVHCTIITISESPSKAGVLWVGTDDGLVHVSQDDGVTWTNVRPIIKDVPADTWCSRVTASKYREGRAFATFDGHRFGDFNCYVYMTDDFGKSWTKLSGDIPENDVAYVIREGEKNSDLLFLGTEMSLFVSLDRGKTWTRMTNGFPTVAVHDVVIHPRDQDLVIATHGRSIWILPISPLEQLTETAMAKGLFVCKPAPAYQLGRQGRGMFGGFGGDRDFVSRNTQPAAYVYYWLSEDSFDDVTVTITRPDGSSAVTIPGSKKKGLNLATWNIRGGDFDFGGSRAGDYRVTVKAGRKEAVTMLRVEDVSASFIR